MADLSKSRRQAYVLHQVLDPLVIIACCLTVLTLRTTNDINHYIFGAITSSVLFLAFGKIMGLYNDHQPNILDLRPRRLGVDVSRSGKILFIWLMVFSLALGLLFGLKLGESFSRVIVLSWACLVPMALIVHRSIVHIACFGLSGNRHVERIAIIGSGPAQNDLVREISLFKQDFRLVGCYEASSSHEWYPHLSEGISFSPSANDAKLEVVGDLDSLRWDVDSSQIDTILAVFPLQNEQIREFIEEMSEREVRMMIVPDHFAYNLLSSHAVHIGRRPAFSLFQTNVVPLVKRIEDILIAGFCLSLAALPMLMIAVGVKLTSRGPVFFRQRRFGLGGQEIRVWKFRTMTTLDDGATVQQATRDDKRITPFGGFLRRTSLDELPQLFNVLGGSMSMVGPRPHAVAHNEKYRSLIPGYMLRHKMKPGITGLAQIRGLRGETETVDKMERRVEADLEYIRNWTVMLDIKIIILTPFVLMQGNNAY